MTLLNGVKVSMSGQEYILPPLTLGTLKRLGGKLNTLANITTVPNEEQCDVMCEIVHASLTRNYPEVTKETLYEMLDLGNMQVVFQAVLGVSGIKEKSQGEVPSP